MLLMGSQAVSLKVSLHEGARLAVSGILHTTCSYPLRFDTIIHVRVESGGPICSWAFYGQKYEPLKFLLFLEKYPTWNIFVTTTERRLIQLKKELLC